MPNKYLLHYYKKIQMPYSDDHQYSLVWRLLLEFLHIQLTQHYLQTVPQYTALLCTKTLAFLAGLQNVQPPLLLILLIPPCHPVNIEIMHQHSSAVFLSMFHIEIILLNLVRSWSISVCLPFVPQILLI